MDGVQSFDILIFFFDALIYAIKSSSFLLLFYIITWCNSYFVKRSQKVISDNKWYPMRSPPRSGQGVTELLDTVYTCRHIWFHCCYVIQDNRVTQSAQLEQQVPQMGH